MVQLFMTIPYAITVAFFCSVLIALMLIVSRYGPSTIVAPGSRFKFSVLVGWLSFLAAVVYGSLYHSQMDGLDILAGVSVLLSATILGFVFWSLIVWGFTLNMLLAIAAQDNPISLDQWIKHYLGESDTDRLTTDRIRILLFARLASLDQNQTYHLTSNGYYGARIYRLVRGLFGVSSE